MEHNSENGELVRKFDKIHDSYITAVMIHPKGKYVFTSSEDGSVKKADLSTG